ncbi:MAG: hypothetical protein QMC79_04210 [Anaerosomatales bacterium]|nr:hypothetical protein [Anaerosomatales bacterium]
MLARGVPPEGREAGFVSAVRGAVAALFLTWRLLLTRAFGLVADTARRITGALSYRPRPRLLLAFARAPRATFEAADAAERGRLAAFGLRAFIAGALIAGAVERVGGTPLSVSAGAWLGVALWAAARIAIVSYVGRDLAGRRTLLAASVAALAPYLIASTPALRVVAFLLSAYLMHETLRGAGVDDRGARTLVAFSFGAQALVVVAGWLLGGVFVLVG